MFLSAFRHLFWLLTFTAVLVHIDPTIVHLTIDGETVETTPEHPFYVMDSAPWLATGETAGRWVNAGELQVGDAVRQADGTTGFVQAVVVVGRSQPMYNLTVAVAHTFFVGEQQWLVHNCNKVHSVYNDGTKVYEGQQPPRLGEAKPDPDAVGPHTRLRWDQENKRVYQGREFDGNGNPLRDIDFTNPTYPNGTMRPGHPGPPHQQRWIPNPTGGSRQRSKEREIFP